MANIKDSQLPVASALAGTEIVAIVQGAESRRTTAQAIANLGGGLSNPMTTAGDIIVAGASGAPQRLPVGANGSVLGVVAGAPAYVPQAAARDAVTDLAISSGVVNIDCSAGDFFTLLLNANVTSITFSNLPATGRAVSLAIRIRQDATGGRTLALPASFRATTGSDTAIQSAANAWTLVTLTTFDQGTRWEYTMRGVAA